MKNEEKKPKILLKNPENEEVNKITLVSNLNNEENQININLPEEDR